MIIYNATWCDCIYESSYGTIGLHKTREGAEQTIEKHKIAEEAQYYEMVQQLIDEGYYDKDYAIRHPYIQSPNVDYKIFETELLDL